MKKQKEKNKRIHQEPEPQTYIILFAKILKDLGVYILLSSFVVFHCFPIATSLSDEVSINPMLIGHLASRTTRQARDLLLESMTLMLPNGVMQHPAEVVKDTTFQRATCRKLLE